MKKIIHYMFLGILLLGNFLFMKEVSASNSVILNYSQQPDIFFTRRGGGYDYVSMAFPYYEINGDVVYCVETGVNVTDWDYVLIEDGYEKLPYDPEIMSIIQLIGHYGYNYPGHEHYNYRIAAQSLIWEIQGNTIVELWTERYGYGKQLNVNKEKAEIMELVNTHSNKPSFEGTSSNAYLNQEITIEDTSGVLERFEVYDDGGNEVQIVGNKLIVNPKVVGESTITLIKSNYDDLTTIVYGGVDGVSQKMARLRAGDPVISTINLNTIGSKITLQKVDSETGLSKGQGNATLKNAVYGIYDENDVLLERITTDENGVAVSGYLNKTGNLKVKEISASEGYKLDPTVYTINVDNGLNNTLKVKEEVIKGKIKIQKYDSETNSCKVSGMASLTGAKYEIKDHNGNIVDTLTIGNDCTATSKDLPYGNYSVKEISAPTGYYLDSNTYYANIKDNNTVSVTSKEDVIKGRIKINKVDSETKTCNAVGQATLVGAKFTIKDHNGNIVDTLTIGNDCSATSKYLPYGKYTIEELSASSGYYINTEVFNQFISQKLDYPITVEEKVIKNYISILKQYDYVDGNSTLLNAEPNITFEIFNLEGSKYAEITTDKNGYASIEMPYGVWKFHQVNSTSGFEKIYDFYITIDENSEKEQYYNVLNNKISAYLQVVKIDSETGKTIALPNTKFKILNTDTNQYVTQYIAGKVYDTFSTDETGIVTTYLKLEAGNYKLVEIESPKGYVISDEGLDFTIGENTEYNYTTYGSFVVVEFENTPIKGRLEIYKTGERFILKDSIIYNKLFYKTSSSNSNESLLEDYNFIYDKLLLEGVKFNLYADEDIKSSDGNYLYYSKGDLVETLITNEDGYVISSKLPLGKYYVVEIETNDNYILNQEEYHFELTETDNNAAIVYNTYKAFNYLKKGTLEFTKLDLSTSEPLPNTLIEIYTDNDELIFTGRTNDKGKITIKDLAIGKYYILEKEAPEGYILNEDKMYFEIKENGEIVKSTMTNKKITSTLKINKVDEDGNSLVGVKFGIYDLEDNLLFEKETNEEGYIEIELEYGKYYFKEIETVEGYILNDEKINFEVTENGAIIEETIVNEIIKGSFELTKKDFATGESVPNALIEIFNETGELVFSGRTDENGLIIVENLKYGKYSFVEKEAPEGYVLNDETHYFEILENNQIVKDTLTNKFKEIEVPNTLSNSYFIFIPIGMLVLGIILLIIDKKRKK